MLESLAPSNIQNKCKKNTEGTWKHQWLKEKGQKDSAKYE
jgi:hypothetical protein